MMLRERVAPQSEVIRVIVLEDSPCCGGDRTERGELLQEGRVGVRAAGGQHEVPGALADHPARDLLEHAAEPAGDDVGRAVLEGERPGDRAALVRVDAQDVPN